MMSMRDRDETEGQKTTKFPIGHADGDPPSPPPRSDMPNIDRSDQKLTLGSTTLTWDQQTAADGEGGTPRSCTVHATAHLHTRIRQRSSKRRRGLPKSFGLFRIWSGLRHVHLALACASRKELRKLRHLTKWAGAAVRMGQQGGQTEALWTHLDPSKPQERLHAPADAHARSAATCHSHRTRATAAMANSPWRGSVLLRWFYCT